MASNLVLKREQKNEQAKKETDKRFLGHQHKNRIKDQLIFVVCCVGPWDLNLQKSVYNLRIQIPNIFSDITEKTSDRRESKTFQITPFRV